MSYSRDTSVFMNNNNSSNLALLIRSMDIHFVYACVKIREMIDIIDTTI